LGFVVGLSQAPIPEDEARVLASKELGAVTGQCYDLVCNGTCSALYCAYKR
jgi:hypothetical protein